MPEKTENEYAPETGADQNGEGENVHDR
jgi:hypothetical protein